MLKHEKENARMKEMMISLKKEKEEVVELLFTTLYLLFDKQTPRSLSEGRKRRWGSAEEEGAGGTEEGAGGAEEEGEGAVEEGVGIILTGRVGGSTGGEKWKKRRKSGLKQL